MRPGPCLVACGVVALSTLLPLSLHAADIYRWVDEEGRTHMSDTVPDKYRNSATRVDTGPEPTLQQREEAAARAALEKKRAEEAAQRRSRQATDAGAGAAPLSPASPIKPPPSASRSASDCAELLRRYRESQECYAPYRMANGAIRPEGFVLCGPDVPDPSGQCVLVNPD